MNSTDDGWRIDVPLPGVDPRNVNREVAGNTLAIRANEPGENGTQSFRYEQTFTVPPFLNLENIYQDHAGGTRTNAFAALAVASASSLRRPISSTIAVV
jgi:hypothetical protein